MIFIPITLLCIAFASIGYIVGVEGARKKYAQFMSVVFTDMQRRTNMDKQEYLKHLQEATDHAIRQVNGN